MSNPLQKQIQQALWPANASSRMGSWAVLDAARDRRIYGVVQGSHLERACLYTGDLPWQLEMAAPYLAQLSRDDAFTAQLIAESWGHSWGVFLRTEAGFKQLCRHLRGLLTVFDERGERLLFRWYDPRVLRVYLPTCSPVELELVFGPIEAFVVEGETARMLTYRMAKGKLLVEEAQPVAATA